VRHVRFGCDSRPSAACTVDVRIHVHTRVPSPQHFNDASRLTSPPSQGHIEIDATLRARPDNARGNLCCAHARATIQSICAHMAQTYLLSRLCIAQQWGDNISYVEPLDVVSLLAMLRCISCVGKQYSKLQLATCTPLAGQP